MHDHPLLPPVYIRLERDEEFIAALEEAIYGTGGFLELLRQGRISFKSLGYKPKSALAA